MIDDFSELGVANLSFCIPVPGRMGANRVAFFPPIEDESENIPHHAFLPILPQVKSGIIDSDEVFVVSNHEELDEVLKEVEG